MTMFQDVKVTLYDIFGYLLPGFVFLAGLVFRANAFRRFRAGTDESHGGSWEQNRLNTALWDTLLYTFSFFD
jgi:hypothetical protein